MHSLRWILVIALLVMAGGCQYALPPGYVKVEPGWDVRFRAVSAEGSAITLRSESNPENGDLPFWEKAIKNQLVDIRGYALVDRRDINRSGQTTGVEMTFDYNKDGIDYTYLVMLLVKSRQVHCIEVAGVKDQIAPELPAIKDAVGKWPL